MIRSTGLLAPLASFVLPGSGQLLQGRFDVGVRHASLAILLAAVGVPMSAAGTGLAVVILGCWSAYDAWHRRHGKESTTAARSSLTDAATAGPTSNGRVFPATSTSWTCAVVWPPW
jgi:hypothetical protein